MFQVGTVIKIYIEDLVKLHAEEKQTENVEKSWRKCKEVTEISYCAKEMWQEERK